MPGWEIIVDRDICMGSGMCYMYAANTFDIDDTAKSYVKDAEGDPIESNSYCGRGLPDGGPTSDRTLTAFL